MFTAKARTPGNTDHSFHHCGYCSGSLNCLSSASPIRLYAKYFGSTSPSSITSSSFKLWLLSTTSAAHLFCAALLSWFLRSHPFTSFRAWFARACGIYFVNVDPFAISFLFLVIFITEAIATILLLFDSVCNRSFQLKKIIILKKNSRIRYRYADLRI